MSSSANPIKFRDRREWLAAAARYSNQKIVEQKAIWQELQNSFPEVWERLKDHNYNFTAIFIGAASDSIEVSLMQDFLQARGTEENLEFFAQNISPLMREDFYTHASKLGLADLVKAYDLYRFEDSRYQPPQCDFALASHCWAYISGWRNERTSANSLAKFVDLLKPSSVGLINLQSNKSDPFLLLSNYLSIENTYSESSSEDVIYELDKLGIPYQVNTIDASTDISSCFKNNIFEPNTDGKMLLSNWLHTWWDDLSTKSQTQIGKDLSLLIKKNGQEKLILRHAFIWLSTD